MKAVKRLIVCTMVAVPLMMIPAKSHAGTIGDILKQIFGNDNNNDNNNKDKKQDPGSPGTSVPLDGELWLLLAAGLGLGAKKIYDGKRTQVRAAEL